MSTTIRAQVNLLNDTNVPRDVAVNTFHFQSDGAIIGDDLDGIASALEAFYQSIDGLMSRALTGTVVVKYYNLVDVRPRAPIRTASFSITPASTTSLPNEVAICMSYSAASLSGVSPALRRGRIFLGPWAATVIDDGTGDAIVDAGVHGAISSAAEALSESGEGETWEWSVFSPTTAGSEPWTSSELLGATHRAVQGYVDNAFDTVRSRGVAATTRTSWSNI